MNPGMGFSPKLRTTVSIYNWANKSWNHIPSFFTHHNWLYFDHNQCMRLPHGAVSRRHKSVEMEHYVRAGDRRLPTARTIICFRQGRPFTHNSCPMRGIVRSTSRWLLSAHCFDIVSSTKLPPTNQIRERLEEGLNENAPLLAALSIEPRRKM